MIFTCRIRLLLNNGICKIMTFVEMVSTEEEG